MKKRHIAPRKPAPILVQGPDDDRSRTIEKLQRENRHLARVNASMADLLRQIERMTPAAVMVVLTL